jgi:hypothetical protein
LSVEQKLLDFLLSGHAGRIVVGEFARTVLHSFRHWFGR